MTFHLRFCGYLQRIGRARLALYGSGISAGEEEEGRKVVLNGSDRNGKALKGQDAIFEDSKQWHDSAFPSYLQSKKDDFCQSWEEAMQVRTSVSTTNLFCDAASEDKLSAKVVRDKGPASRHIHAQH